MIEKIIDPHVHFFDLQQGEYEWLKAENPPFWADKAQLVHNFSEQHIHLHSPLALAGYVHIEAGFDNAYSEREVGWIQKQAQKPMRAIAYLDVRLPPSQFSTRCGALLANKAILGLRQIIENEQLDYLNEVDVNLNLACLAQLGGLFEFQFDAHLKNNLATVARCLARHANLRFVLNHQGLGWASDTYLHELAQFKNLWVKCSGFEMLDREFSFEVAGQSVQACVKHFGEERVMLASNFPLIIWRCSYQEYWSQLLSQLHSRNLPVEKLAYQNAKVLYQF